MTSTRKWCQYQSVFCVGVCVCTIIFGEEEQEKHWLRWHLRAEAATASSCASNSTHRISCSCRCCHRAEKLWENTFADMRTPPQKVVAMLLTMSSTHKVLVPNYSSVLLAWLPAEHIYRAVAAAAGQKWSRQLRRKGICLTVGIDKWPPLPSPGQSWHTQWPLRRDGVGSSY